MNSIFTFHKQPRLTLVGAGPGDPELITLKAVNALKSADVVLYDALVSPEILEMIPPAIPLVPVGKRAGAHSVSQESINDLIVELAFLYGHVVRLKGGDPFVFGRASEEIECAIKHGIETSVVPGITSAIAAPASLQIPVTSRGISESFWVITGTTSTGAISNDISLAAQSTATIVILMGLNKIKEIVEILTANGRAETPVAVIQNATLDAQQAVVGTVSTIIDMVQQEKIEAPAVIVVGDVVKYARDLQKVVASQFKQS